MCSNCIYMILSLTGVMFVMCLTKLFVIMIAVPVVKFMLVGFSLLKYHVYCLIASLLLCFPRVSCSSRICMWLSVIHCSTSSLVPGLFVPLMFSVAIHCVWSYLSFTASWGFWAVARKLFSSLSFPFFFVSASTTVSASASSSSLHPVFLPRYSSLVCSCYSSFLYRLCCSKSSLCVSSSHCQWISMDGGWGGGVGVFGLRRYTDRGRPVRPLKAWVFLLNSSLIWYCLGHAFHTLCRSRDDTSLRQPLLFSRRSSSLL